MSNFKMGPRKRHRTWFRSRRSRTEATRKARRVLEPLEPRLVLDGGALMISELMAVNSSTLADEDGDFADWIEIYNPSDTPVDLEGWYLTDDADDLTKWEFPSHVLAPDEYVVVFASDKDRAEPGLPLHTNFKLSGGGEYLALVEADGSNIAHEFSPAYPEQSTDVSYGYTFSSSTFVSEGAELTYLVPTAGEAALGNAWTAPDFDDSNWNGSNVFDRILITEAGTTFPTDFVEIQNVSDETVDTSGWVVALNHGLLAPINNVHPILWYLPDSMEPGEILYRSDATWGSDIVWASTGPNWAMIVDDEGNVVDFIPWKYQTADLAALDVTINGFPITLGGAWSGASFNPLGIQSNFSFQRRGSSDGNTAADWAVTSATMGTQNAGLPVPFSSKCYTGIGYATGSPGLEEAIRTDVTADMHGVNSSLWTRIRFDVPDPSAADGLTLQMKYNDAFVAYLNGQPIAGRNAPNPPQWNSRATAGRSVADSLQYEEINVSAHLDQLLPGTNVLAIHALNASADDDDFLMLPRLVGTSHQAQSQYFHSPTPGGPNSAGFVVINEIHYDPEENSQHVEFIELVNTTARPIDLSGWRFDDGVRFTFPQGTVIPGAGYLVVAEDPAAVQTRFGVSALGPWRGRLDNEGETIVLLNELEQLQDEVSYQNTFPWPIAARGDGSSMELIHPSLDNDLGGSWRPSGYQTLSLPGQTIDPAEAAPTPGRPNSVFSSRVPPQIRQVAHEPQQPVTGEAVVVTAKVTDPNGVAEVNLAYQLVLPGAYIPAFLPLAHGTLLADPYRDFSRNPAYDNPANWTTVVMRDDGTGVDATAGDDIYTASIPPQTTNRTLVRYRITATDRGGVSDAAPYRDDPSMNFAYYVYDGVPDYVAQTRSVQPDGAGHVYPSEMLTSLPVYTLITRTGDLEDCIGYNSADRIPSSNDGARRRFNWEGTFVYDGVVYDHVLYRLRQHNDRYGLNGKRSMRFRFPKGHYFQAYDNYGNPYPTQWRTLNTGKMFDNKDVGNFGLTETINNNLWNLVGVPAPWMHTFHFRVVDGAEEAPTGTDGQHYGDFWGMFLALEDYDARFLDAHGLPDGNLYKLKNGIFDGNRLKRHQGRDSVANDADFQNIRNYLRPTQSDAWLDTYVNYDRWNWYHAVVEGVRHYDVRPADSHLKNRAWYFEPYEGSPYGRLWTLPHDSDASWGPNWNAGEDYSKNAIFGGTGKPAFKQDYRNTIREFRDLVWTEEVILQMIDDLAAFVTGFSQADRDRWRSAPAAAGYQDFGPIEAKIQDMKNFAFVGWTEPWANVGPAVPAGGRAAHLDSLA
ncbi:MAG TPA: lamin tail domain-containing protein, partial [Thermoguttaceae bacterium]|nr:lamin tail domain-containing protein [Thermoguttaceae bacterium]